MRSIQFASIAFLLLTGAFASPSDWQVLDGSAFEFVATFEGAAIPGKFEEFDIVLEFDPDEPKTNGLTVNVDLRRADMGDDEINAIIADPVWFSVAKYPRATFTSDRIAKTSDTQFVASGTLDLKGVRKPLDIPLSIEVTADGAALRGEFSVARTDFDVGSGEWASADAIGIDVDLRFDIRLRRID